MADHRDTSVAPDPIALTVRLMSLLPRLASAMSQASYRQLREVTGLDYSLIDYEGVLAAAGQFALAWWLDPLRALSVSSTQNFCSRSSPRREGQHSAAWGQRAKRSKAVTDLHFRGSFSNSRLLMSGGEALLRWHMGRLQFWL